MKTKKTSGFTLVEILIVVVILGILAAIVIPQFTNASTEAKLSALCGNLRIMRAQIELYRIRHNDLLPGQTVAGGNIVEADFSANLMNDGVYAYVQKFPKNPYITTAANQTRVTCVNNAAAMPAGNEGTGWWINAATGDFRAASAGHTGL